MIYRRRDAGPAIAPVTEHQYFAVVVPVLAWASLPAAPRVLHRYPRLAPALALLVSLAFSLGPLRYTDRFLPGERQGARLAAVALIPADAHVCPSSVIGAHLGLRRRLDRCEIFEYARSSHAPYQIFEGPFSAAERRWLAELRARGGQVLLERDGVVVVHLAGGPGR